MLLTLIALVSLPIPLVLNREQGWLRRISTTPVHPGWLLAAQACVNLALALMATVVILAGGWLVYGVSLPADPAGFGLAFVLATAALFSLGLLITAVAPSAPVAAVLGTVLLYPLLFLAGLWAPRDTLSPIFQTVGDYTPLAAAAQAMQSAMSGAFPSPLPLCVMAAWTLVTGLAAVRLFRWE
jgi:ABC-2 type transport system permease protein